MGIFLLSLALAASPGTPERDMPITADEAPEAAPAVGADAPASPDAPPAEPAPAPEPAPAAEPEPVARLDLSPEERTAEATRVYRHALDAWNDRRWSRALYLASQALELDPELAPARLLAGYALLKLRKPERAAATLDGLALEPGPSSVPLARRLDAEARVVRALAPFQRDAWAFTVATAFYGVRRSDRPQVLNGVAFALRAPVFRGFALRAEGGAPWSGSANDLDVRGPRFSINAVTTQPIGKGKWHVEFGGGPALWIAEARYWPDGWEPYVGARGLVALDTRLGAATGMRFELGASTFPAALDDLPFYASPFDLRISFEAWFGGPSGRDGVRRATRAATVARAGEPG